MLHRSCVLVLAIAGATAAGGQIVAPAERSANIEAFEKVWTTVRDKHWDSKPGGLDWQAVHDELRPKMEAAKTADEGRAILNDMVGRLKQTHFGIFPGSVYHDLDASADSGDANPGIYVRVLESHAIVTELEGGSPAAAKGVKPGWEILRIGDTDIPPVVARIQEHFKDPSLLDVVLRRSVLSRLQGSAGSTVSVEFLDGADGKLSIDLDRALARGTIARLGNLPPFRVWSEWRRLPQEIGYV